jgi:transposase
MYIEINRGANMHLRKVKNIKNGRTYLSIVHSYWDATKKQSCSKTIRSLGYLDELEKTYDDPIAFFTAEAKRMEEQRLKDNASYTFSISKQDRIDINTNSRKNFGYAALSTIFHELGIHTFLINRQRHSKEEFDANTIMKMLTFSRLLYPASKKKSYEERSRFFESEDYSLDDVYRCLSFLCKHKDNLQLWVNDKIKELYGRDSSLVYYDVTNYYFETDEQDDMRKKGVSKEHRPNPIVQMGLFIDNNGLPITYELFPGNTNDCLTYRPNLKRIKTQYELGKAIVVADKGMTTGDNIWYTLSAGDGYVFSMSVRGADKELRDYVLNENGYEWLGEEYKRKSRRYPRTIQVTSASGRKLKKTVDEKQVIFYSEKYDKRAKADRAAAIAKAQDLIAHPGKYSRATSYGAAAYIKNIDFDKDTGEILSTGKVLALDEKRIKDEEALDGYYVIVTSEMEETDDSIIEMYRGLWRIEESFRVTKSDLEARPVFVSTQDHIEAHFLICFISLVIARILEMKTNHKYSITKMLESLRKSECSHIQQNHYLFNYYDEVLKEIGEKTSIDFSHKCMTLGDIKKILAKTKK